MTRETRRSRRAHAWWLPVVVLLVSCGGATPDNELFYQSEGLGERCRSNDDCSRNLHCWATPEPAPGCGFAQPPIDGCQSDADCADGLVCGVTRPNPSQCTFEESRACVPPCESHSACQPWQICDSERGTCEVVACSEADPTCPSNFECLAGPGQCYPIACRSSVDCADGWVCYDELCMAPNCRLDGDCGEGEYCVEGRCGNARCERDRDCRHAEFDTCLNGRCAEQQGWCHYPQMAP